MTRRERLEARAERRREWAASAAKKSESDLSAAHKMADGIPLGQPILVGHHSERRDRRFRESISRRYERAQEESERAAHHEQRASGIEAQLDRSIFSDDPDAIEQLRAKLEALRIKREWCSRVNAAWRKAKKPAPENGAAWEAIAASLGCELKDLTAGRENMISQPYHGQPYPAYVGQNISGNMTRIKQRIEDIERRAKRAAEAEAAGGVKVVRSGHEGRYCAVTFAEKPERGVIDALKAADFHWSGGSWYGESAKLPAGIEA